MGMFFQVTEGSRTEAAVDCRGKRNTHIHIYSVSIAMCIFGELPLYVHCAAYCLYGRGASRIPAALAATQVGVLELEDGLRFEKSETNTFITSRKHLELQGCMGGCWKGAGFLSAS